MSLPRVTGVGFLLRVLAVAISAATHLWLARELGPAGYGAFALALVVHGGLALTADLGLGSALAYRIAQDPADSRRLVVAAVLGSAMVSTVVLPLASLVLLTGRLALVPGLHPGWIAAALLAAPLRLAQEDLASACVGLGRVGRSILQSVMLPFVFLCLLLALRVVGSLDQSGVAFAWLLAQLGAVVIASALTFPVLSSTLRWEWSGGLHTSFGLLALGMPQTLNMAAWWLLVRTDRAIIGAVAGIAAVGRFSVAASLVEILLNIPSVVGLSLFERLTREEEETAARSVQRLTRLTTTSLTIVALMTVPAGAFVLQAVLGESYADVGLTVVVLLPGIIALTPATILGGYFFARLGRPVMNLVPTSAALTALVPAVWMLTERWGIVGAGLGTSLAYIMAGAVAVALFSRQSGLDWRGTLLATPADGRMAAALLFRRIGRGR